MNIPNDGSFFEQYQAKLKAQERAAGASSNAGHREDIAGAQEAGTSVSTKPPLPPASPPPASELEGDFVASSSFHGCRSGYVFKMDSQGLGYYKDVPLHIRKQQADAVKAKPPAVIKSRPIVSVPAPKGGVQKKQKPEENKSRYIAEMEKYKSMSCGSDTKHDRPLVK